MSRVRPPDKRPPLQIALSDQRVTEYGRSPYAHRVAKEWPADQFRDYLAELMHEAGFANFAEISRATGVSQWQFSQWTRGLAQPSAKSLRRIAPALEVAPVKLFIMAGLNESAELELSHEPDLRVGPAEFQDLAELWDDSRLTAEQRSFVRRSIATLVVGLRAELPRHPGTAKDRPSGGRRTA